MPQSPYRIQDQVWADESPTPNDLEAPPDANVKCGPDMQDSSLCVHLMSVSAGMIGVCLTVIGLFRLVENHQKAGSIADNLVAIDSLLFMAVCTLSYVAMRTSCRKTRQRLERIADVLFLSALVFMAIICSIIAFTIA